MTHDVLLAKLESLEKINSRLDQRRSLTATDLANDIDQQDIVMLNLERAVQVCVDLAVLLCTRLYNHSPQSSGESFDFLAKQGLIPNDLAARLRKAVGFRNIAVHEYARVDLNIVEQILKSSVNDFSAFAKILMALPKINS